MSKLFSVLPARLLLLPLLAIPGLWAQEAASAAAPAGTSPSYPAIVHMTAEQDHARTMYLLNMRLIRLGKDSDGDGRFPANYDESKANPFPTLPDPLILKGKKNEITSAKVWWEKRRPQIVEDFDREIYGRVPAKTPEVKWELKSTTDGTDGGIPTKIETLVGHVDNSAYPLINVDIQMVLTLPADQSHAVPVIISLDRATGMNHAPATVLVAAVHGASALGTKGAANATWQQQILAHGWGYATLSTESIQQDSGAGLTEGIIGLCNHGQPRELADWGALRAWAWGASRALDYLATDPAVDAHQVGIEGHSRYGKAALVAMAYDQRFAIGYISSSGEGGAKLSRRNYGETLENVTGTREYHWMAGNFLRYAGPLGVNDLPVDAHELIALCAPRPVFIGGGVTDGDGWADSKGMFMAAVAAGPVYRLLGKKDLTTASFPATETPLVGGDLAFRQHNGGHTPDPNWPAFLTFAARYLKEPAGANSNRQIAAATTTR